MLSLKMIHALFIIAAMVMSVVVGYWANVEQVMWMKTFAVTLFVVALVYLALYVRMLKREDLV